MAKNDMASKFGLSYLSRRRERERAEAPQSMVQRAPTASSPWLEHAYLAVGSAVIYQLGTENDGCMRLHDLIRNVDADNRTGVEVDLELMLRVVERLIDQNLVEYAERDKFGNHLLCRRDG